VGEGVEEVEEEEERWSLAADCRRTANMAFRLKDTSLSQQSILLTWWHEEFECGQGRGREGRALVPGC
jgi:hypothetical protein